MALQTGLNNDSYHRSTAQVFKMQTEQGNRLIVSVLNRVALSQCSIVATAAKEVNRYKQEDKKFRLQLQNY